MMNGPTSYDEVPYPSYSYTQTHPDRLATLATVFGMTPAAVKHCRVLEIGCAAGGNLIPMAYGLPESQFLGIDLAARQIAEGQQLVATLGLENVTLATMDLCDLPADIGQFDYIIAHGVYSWVPADVRDRLLALMRRCLAPQGIGYISYNAYPGWHTLEMIRNMMLYRTRGIVEPQQRADQARAFLQFLSETVPERKGVYGSFLKMYAAFLNKDQGDFHHRQDALFLHDELEAINDPVYFYQFVDHIEQHDLQYLAEAEFRTIPPGESTSPIAAVGQLANNLIEGEQYLDFIFNRTFRQTLLCHGEVELSRVLRLDHLQKFYLAGQSRPTSAEPDLAAGQVEQFQGITHRDEGQMAFSTDHPLTKAALVHLAEIRPAFTTFNELVPAARTRLESATGQPLNANFSADVESLGANLLGCYTQGLVSLHTYQPQLATTVSERPFASPVARLLAEERAENLTNLRHERVTLDRLDHYLLRRLDGTRDLSDLLQAVLTDPMADDDPSKVEPADSSSLAETERKEDVIERKLRFRLAWLARTGLLVH